MALDLSMFTTLLAVGSQALTAEGAKFLAAGLAIAFAEALGIYSLIVAVILLFVV